MIFIVHLHESILQRFKTRALISKLSAPIRQKETHAVVLVKRNVKLMLIANGGAQHILSFKNQLHAKEQLN